MHALHKEKIDMKFYKPFHSFALFFGLPSSIVAAFILLGRLLAMKSAEVSAMLFGIAFLSLFVSAFVVPTVLSSRPSRDSKMPRAGWWMVFFVLYATYLYAIFLWFTSLAMIAS